MTPKLYITSYHSHSLTPSSFLLTCPFLSSFLQLLLSLIPVIYTPHVVQLLLPLFQQFSFLLCSILVCIPTHFIFYWYPRCLLVYLTFSHLFTFDAFNLLLSSLTFFCSTFFSSSCIFLFFFFFTIFSFSLVLLCYPPLNLLSPLVSPYPPFVTISLPPCSTLPCSRFTSNFYNFFSYIETLLSYTFSSLYFHSHHISHKPESWCLLCVRISMFAQAFWPFPRFQKTSRSLSPLPPKLSSDNFSGSFVFVFQNIFQTIGSFPRFNFLFFFFIFSLSQSPSQIIFQNLSWCVHREISKNCVFATLLLFIETFKTYLHLLCTLKNFAGLAYNFSCP